MNLPKGTRDYFGKDMQKKRFVINKMHDVFSRFGYNEIMTPAFEHLEVLEKKGALGGDNVKDVYRFTDKGGRPLGLRFDMTTPIARAIGTHNFSGIQKFSYVTNMWRYEAPGKGRKREFWQAGFEYVGTTDTLADAEVLAVNSFALDEIGLSNHKFRINSRESMDKLFERLGVNSTSEVYSHIDKIEKMPESVWNDKLMKLTSAYDSIISLFSMSQDDIKNSYGEDFEPIFDIITKSQLLGVSSENLSLDLSIIRGLDYYTGFVYETQVNGNSSIGSISSGGRYDTLLEKLGAGKAIPATGTALGVDRILEHFDIESSDTDAVVIYPLSQNELSSAGLLQQELHALGKNAFVWPSSGKMSKNLKRIHDAGYSTCYILGEDEVKNGSIVIKDLTHRSQISVSRKEVL